MKKNYNEFVLFFLGGFAKMPYLCSALCVILYRLGDV